MFEQPGEERRFGRRHPRHGQPAVQVTQYREGRASDQQALWLEAAGDERGERIEIEHGPFEAHDFAARGGVEYAHVRDADGRRPAVPLGFDAAEHDGSPERGADPGGEDLALRIDFGQRQAHRRDERRAGDQQRGDGTPEEFDERGE